MENPQTNPKTELADKLKDANNVLVTVSKDPSVDQLSAAIGLTLFLSSLKKHATTVFSGEVPSTIDFLKPEESIEDNTDSLRDFIIALDKTKADKIRYKVEDDMVKIFVTPYRTSLGEQDLVFSQGDFNVDVVVALGIHDRDDIDQAIMEHGRILHDATVATINTKDGSELGTLNWTEPTASSLCEMVVGVTDLLKANSLDEQMATAFLTGVVAETERFSNEKTTSTTMNASAKLMAAGANQQLVATKLQDAPDFGKSDSDADNPPEKPTSDEAIQDIEMDKDGSLTIPHNADKNDEPDDDTPAPDTTPKDDTPPAGSSGDDFALPPLPDFNPGVSTPTAEDKKFDDTDEPTSGTEPDLDNRQFLNEPKTAVNSDGLFGVPANDTEDKPAGAPTPEPIDTDTNFVTEPPQFGGQLRAAPNDDVDVANPLNLPPLDTPMLSHDPVKPAEPQVQSQNATTANPFPVINPVPPSEDSDDDTPPGPDGPSGTSAGPGSPPSVPPPLPLPGSPPNLAEAAMLGQTPPSLPVQSFVPADTGQPYVDYGAKTLEDIEDKVDGRHIPQPDSIHMPPQVAKALDSKSLDDLEEQVESSHIKEKEYHEQATAQVAKVMSNKTLGEIEEKAGSPHAEEPPLQKLQDELAENADESEQSEPAEEPKNQKELEKSDSDTPQTFEVPPSTIDESGDEPVDEEDHKILDAQDSEPDEDKKDDEPQVLPPSQAHDHQLLLAYEPHESEPPENGDHPESDNDEDETDDIEAENAAKSDDTDEKSDDNPSETAESDAEKDDSSDNDQVSKDKPATEVEVEPEIKSHESSARDAVEQALASSVDKDESQEQTETAGSSSLETTEVQDDTPAVQTSSNIKIDEHGNIVPEFQTFTPPNSLELPKDETDSPDDGDASAPPMMPPPMMPPSS